MLGSSLKNMLNYFSEKTVFSPGGYERIGGNTAWADTTKLGAIGLNVCICYMLLNVCPKLYVICNCVLNAFWNLLYIELLQW